MLGALWQRQSRVAKMAVLMIVMAGSLLASASAASASQRYASTTGSGTACTSAIPCDLPTAVNSAGTGDEVIVNPGTYTIGTTFLNANAAVVHGASGQPKPLIVTSATTAFNANSGATVSDLRIDQTSGSQGLILDGANTVAQRMEVSSVSGATCELTNDALLRDSVCINTAANNGTAVAQNAAGTSTVYARNVTAVATGATSIGVKDFSFGAVDTMDLRNVIARGTAADVQTTVVTGGTGTINLAYSNYTTASNSINGTSNITPVGSPTNQTASPTFVNAPGGDYHEATGSPTIDAGAADARTGTLDLDGEARSQGTSMDIGADEFTVAAPPPPADTTPPETTIDKGPAKKTKSKKATFRFSSNESGSSFECKVDSKPAKACTSPLKLKRVKPGKHKLSVVATDTAGNADPTAATYKWKVKKKH